MDGWPDELTSSDLLACAVAEHPAFRSGAELDRIEPAALSAGERVDLLAVLEEQRRWFEAAQLRLLASMQAGDSSELGLGQEEVSLALQLPLRTAQNRLAQATTLVRELPATLAAVADGSISAAHASVLAEAVWRLPADPALPAALEQAVLPPVLAAGCITVPQLRRRVRRAVLALDPATAEQRHQRALADRRVEYHPGEDGMASLSVFLGAPEAQLLHARLTAAARLLPAEDARTLDQQRADLLVDGLLSGLPEDALPTAPNRRPAIYVVVSADTLLGLDDQPGHLIGYGPLTADTPRRLAAEQPGTWRRLLTDPDTGALLDISERRYRPAQRLRDFINARDDVCAFPPASNPATAANPTTPSPSTRAGPPAGTTSPRPAGDITRPRPAPAGAIDTTRTAATPGPLTPGAPTPGRPTGRGSGEMMTRRHRADRRPTSKETTRPWLDQPAGTSANSGCSAPCGMSMNSSPLRNARTMTRPT